MRYSIKDQAIERLGKALRPLGLTKGATPPKVLQAQLDSVLNGFEKIVRLRNTCIPWGPPEFKQLGIPQPECHELGVSAAFAENCHFRQLRIRSGQAFMVHPLQAWWLVRVAGGSFVEQQAALIHDAPEDGPQNTKWTSPFILEAAHHHFGRKVGRLTEQLTNIEPPEQSLSYQEKLDLADALSAEAKPLRAAESTCNARDVVFHPNPAWGRHDIHDQLEFRCLILHHTEPVPELVWALFENTMELARGWYGEEVIPAIYTGLPRPALRPGFGPSLRSPSY